MTAQQWLQCAHAAADAAETIIAHYYHGEFDVTRKADDSPVTQADVESEQAIAKIIRKAFPDHGFYGEETGRHGDDSRYLWLIDPIDGTKSFVRGYPFLSTQIALQVAGELTVGVSNAPLFNERAWGIRGEGAWLNDQPVRVSDIDHIERATVSTGNLRTLARGEGWSRLGRLVTRCDRIRGYGDFYHYHLLAAGKIEAVIESDVNILDIAALTVVVEAAGGRMTQLDGGPISLETTSVLASNGRLHDALLEALNG